MVALEAIALAVVLCGAGETVLLDFSADWCGPCRMMEPTVRRLVGAGYAVRQINIDREPQAASQFRVTGVPCFVMLRAGREVDRVVGAASYARLEQMFLAARNDPAADGGISSNRGAHPGEVTGAVSGQPTGESRIAPLATEIRQDDRPTEPSLLPAAKQLALQATVRIKVEDAKGQSVGSGTLIDRHGTESLVVTCGHLFRDSGGKGRILVELFADGAVRAVEGQVVSYDLGRDIGLLSIVTPGELRPIPVAPAGYTICRGVPVFSVGCDRGGEARVEESRVTAIDRYLGTPNIEVAGQPVDGRSGGGLFSAEGYLIGVCNAADPSDNEGIFASLPAIHWELDRIGQQRIYQPQVPDQALATRVRQDERTAADNGNSPPAVPLAPVVSVAATGIEHADDTEIICIVRSRGRPQGQERLFILDRPSREFVDRLTQESRLHQSAAGFALSPADIRRTSSTWPIPNIRDNGETVRGQSVDR